jgi:hypothetical protein
MRVHLLSLTLLALFLASPAVTSAAPTAAADRLTEATPAGNRTASRDKKKDRKKDRKKGKKADKKPEKKKEAPEWRWSDGPFTHFIWLARQLPDFPDFPKATREIRVSIVAHREKSLLFLDSCLAKQKKVGWQVSKCNAVTLGDQQFLSRLIKAGTDTTAAPESLEGLQAFVKAVRKTDRKEELLPLLLESTVENQEGYRLLDDIDADLKECGRRSYFKALGTLPIPSYVGTNVVVIDLSYTVERGKSSFKLKASLAKTGKGWRVGGLQVKCF